VTRWTPAYVGLGSNLEQPVAQLQRAFGQLEALPQTLLVARSRMYRTRPFGPVTQNDFVNAAAGLLTQLSAQDLLAALRTIETSQGRQREVRWGPRTLDLDLLVFGTQQLQGEALTLPHPGIAERGFVLVPLADISPTLHVPGLGTVEQLLRRLPDTGIAESVAA
jgi:2-amino-4-hydroxy-6-hydroxymethyldihydropteridine diphosphokinase